MNGLLCADVPLRNYSLSHSHTAGKNAALVHSHNLSFSTLHESFSLMINMSIAEGTGTTRRHKFRQFRERRTC